MDCPCIVGENSLQPSLLDHSLHHDNIYQTELLLIRVTPKYYNIVINSLMPFCVHCWDTGQAAY